MSGSGRRVLLSGALLLGIATWLGCASTGGPAYYSIGPFRLYPLEAEHASEYVIGPMGGLLPSGENAALAIRVDNKSANTIWVRTVIEPSNSDPGWNDFSRLEAGRGTLLQAQRRSVRSETAYPVVFSIFADAAMTQLLEEIRTEFRFSEQYVAEFTQHASGVEGIMSVQADG